MFSNEFELSMDDKGRVFLPARYRDELADSVFLYRGMDGQINIYSKTLWEAKTALLGEQNQSRNAVRHTSRFVFAASECPVDRQGRIVIPPLLRRYANLNTDLVILGNNDHLEIWDRARWQALTEQVLAAGSEMSEKLAELGLSL